MLLWKLQFPLETDLRPVRLLSAMAIVAKMMSANERAFLFVEGRHFDLSNGECAVGHISKIFIKVFTG
jgi:hypothetical protein